MTAPAIPAGSAIFEQRRAGVLLHPTSLPDDGHGDRWQSALRFVRFLADSGFGLWQMLPVGPTHDDGSPYSLLSAHAGSPSLLSRHWLRERGWLDDGELNAETAEIGKLAAARFYRCLARERELAASFEAFCERNALWLEDFALFVALREHFEHRSWTAWPEPLRNHDDSAVAKARSQHRDRIGAIKFEQFAFDRQWQALRTEAHRNGVLLFGDMPIFVAHDSADVWANQRLFCLDENGQPLVVAGVPPDYFSATGQRWGNPLYHWRHMEAEGFAWWRSRLRSQLAYFDLIRIDHFRGFEAYWEIPADASAMDGRWVAAPGEALLNALFEQQHGLPLVAENLGVITDEVEALRHRFGLPGMLVLQFAFDGHDDNPYLPHNHGALEVVYTGTHDNDTTVGWFESIDETTRERVLDYLGRPGEPMPWPLISAALASIARIAVLPMQDLLGLDGSHRMNLPGTSEGNWRWQFRWEQVPEQLPTQLRRLLALYGRLSGRPSV